MIKLMRAKFDSCSQQRHHEIASHTSSDEQRFHDFQELQFTHTLTTSVGAGHLSIKPTTRHSVERPPEIILSGRPQIDREFSSASEINEANWMSLNSIMEDIRIYDRSKRMKPISFAVYSRSLAKKDTIYIFEAFNHAFVGLWLPEHSRTLYIADGSNMFLNWPLCENYFRDLLPGARLEGISFNQQRAIDHCGTSATLIALEFKRIYQTLLIPIEILVPKWLQDRLIRKRHKYPSQPMRDWISIDKRRINRCRHCSKAFKGRKRAPLISHERFCEVRRA